MIVHQNHSEQWHVTVIDTGLNTMIGGRVKRVRDYIDNEPLILTYGDGVSSVNLKKLLAFHQVYGKLVTISAYNASQRFGVLDIDELYIGLSTVFMCLFFTLDPMVIERSYTVYSLADTTDHSDTVYSAKDIKTQFIEGYIEKANESQKRIEEQVSIGNLEEVPGGSRITEKGKNLVKLFRFIETIFSVPNENSIYPNGK